MVLIFFFFCKPKRKTETAPSVLHTHTHAHVTQYMNVYCLSPSCVPTHICSAHSSTATSETNSYSCFIHDKINNVCSIFHASRRGRKNDLFAPSIGGVRCTRNSFSPSPAGDWFFKVFSVGDKRKKNVSSVQTYSVILALVAKPRESISRKRSGERKYCVMAFFGETTVKYLIFSVHYTCICSLQ